MTERERETDGTFKDIQVTPFLVDKHLNILPVRKKKKNISGPMFKYSAFSSQESL